MRFLKEEFNVVQCIKILILIGFVYLILKMLAELGIISELLEKILYKM